MRNTGPMIDQALQQMQVGDFEQARGLLSRVLKWEPKNPRALCVSGILAAETNQRELAFRYMQKALIAGPNMPAVLNNAATMAAKFGDFQGALKHWNRLAKLAPDFAATFFNLAVCHGKMGELELAVEAQRRGVALEPSHPWGYSNLGNYLKDAGRISEAIEAFRQGVRLNPRDIDLHCNLAYAVHFDPDFSNEAIFEENRAWAVKFSDHAPLPAPYSNDRSPGRKLRIGYFSPNFRDHSESYFILPLFRGMDSSKFETYGYSIGREDWVTSLFKEHATHWRHLPSASDEEWIKIIREDEIDILVDLTQHMAGQRLQLFACRPSPIQVIWLAYPSTTGLKQIDYRITDPYLEKSAPEHNSEKSSYLEKCYWCYELIGPDPDVSPLPADDQGFVTFCCLNHHGKVTPPVLKAWREILKRIPNSRLILLVTYPSVVQELERFFSEEGIAPERIECQPRLDREGYMKTYQRADISLDPFPYNGATTTCDALWMGVPVISWAGETPVSRAGWSIMSNIGLPDLVAFSQEEYIRKAVSLAEDLPRLRDLRSTLRETLESSPVMDAELFGEAMGNAYRSMWKEWCENQGATASAPQS